MSLKIITGSTGSTHVTSNNDGEFNEAIYGNGLVVLPNGNRLSARVVDNNTIEISDGDIVFQGRHALIEPNTTETIKIDTGSVNTNRIDLIVAHYELDTTTGYEKLELKVIKGTESAGSPSVPAITEGVIRTGANIAEAVIYQVNINGISLAKITKKAKEVDGVMHSIDAVKEYAESSIAAINSNFVVNEFVFTTDMWAEDSAHTYADYPYVATYVTNKYSDDYVPLNITPLPMNGAVYTEEEFSAFASTNLSCADLGTHGFRVWIKEVPEVSIKFRIMGEG